MKKRKLEKQYHGFIVIEDLGVFTDNCMIITQGENIRESEDMQP